MLLITLIGEQHYRGDPAFREPVGDQIRGGGGEVQWAGSDAYAHPAPCGGRDDGKDCQRGSPTGRWKDAEGAIENGGRGVVFDGNYLYTESGCAWLTILTARTFIPSIEELPVFHFI
jgi:hypothetical protein